jgi:predicted dehydrogenase
MSASPPSSAAGQALTLGFIGGALNSAVGYAHFSAATMDFAWRVEAGCFSRDAQRNAEAGRTYGVASDRVYSDWRAMVQAERGRLDAVVILTPTPDHHEMVIECLRAGLPVICEKALATCPNEVQSIRDELRARKGYLAVTYNYSGYPMVREMREIVRSGRLGRVLHFQAEMPQEGFIRRDRQGNPPKPQAWRLKDDVIPTIYLDLAIHLHHLLGYVLDRQPEGVVAQQASHGWFKDIVDDVNCLCRYGGGVQGHVWFSKSAMGHRNGLRLRIYGSEASMEWYQADPEQMWLCHADGRRELVDRAAPVDVSNAARYGRFKPGHPAGFIEAFANLYRDMADEVRAHRLGVPVRSGEVFGVDWAMQGLQFLDAIQRSAHSQQWEPVGSAHEVVA